MRSIILTPVAFLFLSFSTLLPIFIMPSHAASVSFTFAASGDHRSITATNGLASLNRLQSVGADFYLSLGDMSEDPLVTGDTWCGEFKAKFNNIQIIPGDHDTGGHSSASFGETHSYERYVSGCPLTLGVPLVCGPVAGNCYGKEYYFDYPMISPIARFIFASPKIYNITGACTQALEPPGNWPGCSSQTGQPCTDPYGCWSYDQGDIHYNWVAAAIDNARSSGIKWVIVGTHKLCISASDATCSMNIAFFNMLISKRVDLLIQAHDDSYQRSKQLALNSSTCTKFTTDNNGYTLYNSNCIADSGSRGYYVAGTGTVVTVQGAWSDNLYNVNDTSTNGGANAREAPYFADLMGANTPGPGHGFLKYSVTLGRIDVQTYFSSTFQDSFSIKRPDFTISAGPSNESAISGSISNATITVTSVNSFNGTVTLSEATNSSNLLCNLSPQAISGGSGSSIISCNSGATGHYLTTVTGTSGSLSHSVTFTLIVQDFSVSPSSSSLSVNAGQSANDTITIVAVDGFNGTVSLACSGLPTDSSRSFSPSSTSPAFPSNLTISTGPLTPAGTYEVTISGADEGLTRSAQIMLTVNPSGTIGGRATGVDKLALLYPYVAFGTLIGGISLTSAIYRRLKPPKQ